jgi:hypothetical protein
MSLPDIVCPETHRHETMIIDGAAAFPNAFLNKSKECESDREAPRKEKLVSDPLRDDEFDLDEIAEKPWNDSEMDEVAKHDARIAAQITEETLKLCKEQHLPRAYQSGRRADLHKSIRDAPGANPMEIAAKCNARSWRFAIAQKDNPRPFALDRRSQTPIVKGYMIKGRDGPTKK